MVSIFFKYHLPLFLLAEALHAAVVPVLSNASKTVLSVNPHTLKLSNTPNFNLVNASTSDKSFQPYVSSCSLLSGGQAHACFCYRSPDGNCAYNEATGVCGTLQGFGIPLNSSQADLAANKIIVNDRTSATCPSLFKYVTDVGSQDANGVFASIARNMTALSTNPKLVSTSAAATIAPHLLVTGGSVRGWMFGDGLELTNWMINLMLQAREEVLFTSLGWKMDTKVADAFLHGLRRLDGEARMRKRRIAVKIIWSFSTKLEQVDLRMLGLHPTQYEFLDLSVVPYRTGLTGLLHSKMMVIDRHEVVVNSQNVEDKPWLQMGVHMTGDIVHSLAAHFFHYYYADALNASSGFLDKFMFANKTVNPIVAPLLNNWYKPVTLKTEVTETTGPKSAMVNLARPINASMAVAARYGHGSMTGDSRLTPQEIAWTTAFNTAKQDIFIFTPNFNAKLAIDGVLDALKRGVRVTIVTNYKFNDKRQALLLQGGTNRHVMKKIQKKAKKMNAELSNLKICWYTPASGWTRDTAEEAVSHTKYMLVDNRVLIFGSGNMDTQSWERSIEVNVVLDSETIAPKIHASLLSVMSMQRCSDSNSKI